MSLEIEISVEPFTHDHPETDSPFWEVVVRSSHADYTWGAWTDPDIADNEADRVAELLRVIVPEPVKVTSHEGKAADA